MNRFGPLRALTVELVHRTGAGSRVARSVLGAAAWAGWCLFVALTLAVASRIVLVPESPAAAHGVFAASGAGFSVLAFGGRDARPGIALTLLALVVTVLVILGGAWMAGRWGALVGPRPAPEGRRVAAAGRAVSEARRPGVVP